MQFETHKSTVRNPAQIKRMHASDINIHPLQTSQCCDVFNISGAVTFMFVTLTFRQHMAPTPKPWALGRAGRGALAWEGQV